MVKIINTILLIIAILLFPPSALALISNNAVPGDTIYPLKRVLENGIIVLASVNPTTKAWFATARSDRRFEEYEILVGQGKSTDESLNELVAQADVAASQIAEVSDSTQKATLIEKLSGSLEKYDSTLKQLSEAPTSTPQNNTSTSVVSTSPRPTNSISPGPSATGVTVIPSATPGFKSPLPSSSAPSPIVVQPTKPTSVPASSVVPSPSSVPAPSQDEEEKQRRRQREEEAGRRIREIRRRLEEEKQTSSNTRSNQDSETRRTKKDNC